MITDDDVDNAGKGGGHGDVFFGCSDSSSLTPQQQQQQQLSSSTNNTLQQQQQSFCHRFLFSVRRPCRTRLRRRRNCRLQWLACRGGGRPHRRDELQQIQQLANNTFNIIY